MIAATIVAAQPRQDLGHCDPTLEARQGPFGYRLRGDRCEGTFAKDVNATLQIASLTEFFEDYSLDSGKALLVQWTSPGEEAVRLRAISLKPRTYYRMDTLRPRGQHSYAWPKDLLSGLSLLRGDIGLVGLVQTKVGGISREVYIPLRVSESERIAPRRDYRVVLSPSVELNEVYVALSVLGPSGQPARVLQEAEPLKNGYYPAGRGVEIILPVLLTSGLHYLEIAATLRAGGSDSIGVLFYRR